MELRFKHPTDVDVFFQSVKSEGNVAVSLRTAILRSWPELLKALDPIVGGFLVDVDVVNGLELGWRPTRGVARYRLASHD